MLNEEDAYETYNSSSDCYTFLGSSTIIKEWFVNNIVNLTFENKISYFQTDDCPQAIWRAVPFIEQINKQFPIRRAGFLKLDPYRCYDWHIDVSRGVSINCILTPSIRSHCVFGNPIGIAQLEFIELEYQPDAFYLFNTQIPHMVMNWDETRYMFTVEFEDNKKTLTYHQIKNWLTNQQ